MKPAIVSLGMGCSQRKTNLSEDQRKYLSNTGGGKDGQVIAGERSVVSGCALDESWGGASAVMSG